MIWYKNDQTKIATVRSNREFQIISVNNSTKIEGNFSFI